MIPITQTKVVVKNSKGEEVVRGNCYPAVVASMMELPIEEVPNVEVFYHLSGTFWNEVMLTFINSKGWDLCSDDRFKWYHEDSSSLTNEQRLERGQFRNDNRDKYYLVTGDSPRGLRHICIYQNGLLIHDPHPTKEGLTTLDTFQTLENQ